MTLIAPLLPQLGVSDIPRSHKFYCQVLGFTSNWEHEDQGAMVLAELQLGVAKLQIAAHDGVRDNAEQRSARRATVLFFESDDVAALHAAVQARGGRPSELKPSNTGCACKSSQSTTPTITHCGSPSESINKKSRRLE